MNLITVSSTSLEQLFMILLSCLYQAHPAIDHTVDIDAWNKYHKTASWGLTLRCSKHVEGTISKLKY